MKMTIRRFGASRTDQLVAEAPELQTRLDLTTLAPAVTGGPLFAGMSRAAVFAVLDGFDEARFPTGRRIVLEGLRGSDFFLVVSGTAAVVADGRHLATLGPGDFFGEMAILDEGLRSASVVAQTPLHCLVLPNGKLEEVLREYPQVGLNLLRTMTTRLRGTIAPR